MAKLFSERMGLISSVKEFQLNYIDEPLLNRLWNVYSEFILSQAEPGQYSRGEQDAFTRAHWHNFFKKNYDDAPYRFGDLKEYFRKYFFSTEWYNVYNLIEFGLNLSFIHSSEPFSKSINRVLEEEYSGYRLINNVFVPISNTIENDEIVEALNTSQYVFDGNANIHLKNAIKFLSDKPNPDFRNSIKESISAVGTVLRKITGKNSLGDGLKYLQQSGLTINNQLKEGLNKFYNYTNDPGTGIRHEIVDSPTPPDFETAKFMLLACSAFINYIVPLAKKANIDLNSK